MVLIVVKQNEEDQFLFECSLTTSNDEIIRQLVEIHNFRKKLLRLGNELEKITSAYNPETRSFNFPKEDEDPKPNYQVENQAIQTIIKTIDDAKMYISKDQITRKVVSSKERLSELFENMKGALLIAFPMGVPPNSRLGAILSNTENLSEIKDIFDPETATMWFTSTELLRKEPISKFVKNNNNTKITVKLAKKGNGPPPREPDKQRELEMLSYYHKKQEDQKKADDDTDVSYLSSQWANNGGLKAAFTGLGNVSWKPT